MSGRCADLTGIASLAEAYDRLSRDLALPGHFGRNLDALWDALSTDVPGPFEIVWQRSREAEARMGAEYGRLVRLLRELERARPDVTIVLS